MSKVEPEVRMSWVAWARWLIYPVSLVTFGAVCLMLMTQGVAAALIPALFGLPIIAWVASLERLLPHRAEWNRSHGDLKVDFLHLVFSATAVQQVMAAVLMALVTGLGLAASWWPRDWWLPAQVALAFVVPELFLYAVHRAEHEWSWLWRVHAVHHSAPRLYWMNATRFHPLDEVLLATAGWMPLLLLGCPPEVGAIGAVLAGVNGAFKHANVDVRLGPLNYIVSMAELHRVHHAPDAQRSACNYGGNLMLWDLLFGTMCWPEPADDRADVGLGDSTPPLPNTYLGHIRYPFASTGSITHRG